MTLVYKDSVFSPKALFVAIATCYLLSVVPVEGQNIVRVARCAKPVPGIAKMVRGVDITDFELFPSEGFDQGFKYPVIDLTCKNKLRRKLGSQIFALPDQASSVTGDHTGEFKSTTQQLKSTSAIRKYVGTSLGIKSSNSLFPFSFSSGASFKSMRNAVQNQNKFVSDVSAFVSILNIKLNEDMLALDPYTKQFVDTKLAGTTYASNPEPYEEFIKLFGTHILTEASVGGAIKVTLETDSKFASEHTAKEMETYASAAWDSLVLSAGVNFRLEKSKDEKKENFRKHTTNTIKYYGGETDLLTKDGVKEWQPKVSLNPWIYRGQLEAIYDILYYMGEKYETISEELEKATKQHIYRVFLKDSLEHLQGTSEYFDGIEEVEKFIKEIQELQNSKSLDSATMKTIEQKITNNLVLPAWFSENSKICFLHEKATPESVCDKERQGGTCAIPGQVTAPYTDKTMYKYGNDFAGGCKMQWAFKSNQSPEWVDDVEFCFKFNTTGYQMCNYYQDYNDKATGRPKLGEFCSKTNEFTPAYLDYSNSHTGACHMSWRLKFPVEKMPLWMKYTKLCLIYQAEGTSQHCNNAMNKKQHEICANINEWTNDYLDSTNSLFSKCKLSWSIKNSFNLGQPGKPFGRGLQ